MPARSNDEIWEKLGKLTATTEQLVETVRTERAEARDDRRSIHEKIEAQGRHIDRVEAISAATAAGVAEVKEKIEEKIEPTVDDFRNLRTKAAGVVVVLLFIGSALATLVTLFIDQIKSWIFGPGQ